MNANHIKKLITNTCKGLCFLEEKVNVQYTELTNIISYSILVDNSDQAKIIGSKGKNIKSIKNIFENVEVESEGRYKKVKVFLDSESNKRSEHVKFKAAKKWDSEPYAQLTHDLYELYSENIEIEFDDVGTLAVFEIRNYRSCPAFIGRSIKHILEGIGKCKGGTIDINYVE